MTEGFRAAGSRVLRVAVLVVSAFAAGCAPSEDPSLTLARTVVVDLCAQNPEYERYFLSIARGSDAPESRARVLQALGDDNLQTALAAVEALGDAPPAEALEPLRRVFETKGGALKRQAAIQLARLGDAAALEHLRGLTADPVQTLSIPAVVVISRSEGAEAFLAPLLRQRMANEDPAVRGEAYAVLGEIGQAWSTRLLVEGLKRERAEERQPAVIALGRTGDPTVSSEIVPFVNTRGLVFASLEALGALGNPDALSAVEKMNRSDEAAVRAYAAVASWKLGRKSQALDTVDKLMQNEEATVRSILAEQLAAVDDPEAWSRLAALAEDPSMEVRVEAIRAIVEQGRPEFASVLELAATDPDYEVATLALTALGRVGSAESLEAVAPLLTSENPYVALSAAQAFLGIHARTPAP